MPSLFRIDRNSLTADSLDPASVVQLPGFEELIEQNSPEPEDAQIFDNETEQETEIDIKQEQLEQLNRQIAEAQARASEIIEQANAEAQRLTEDAIRKGYEEGYNQAMASARQEQENAKRQMEDAVMALKQAKEEVFSQVEESVLDLSLYVAERIIKIQLDHGDEAFLNIVRSTLSSVQNQSNLVVNVSKLEYEQIFADQSSEIATELKSSGVEIKQDLSLKRGDCVIETEYGNINAGIKTQLKRLGNALEESRTE